jgi:DNA-binding beta-propeller fold protein YncE
LLLLAAGLAGALISGAPASASIEQRIAWGSEGSGAGQFLYAQGIETDSTGHVYVADTGNNRVQKFSPRGDFTLAWGWGVRNGESELQTCRNSCQTGIIGPGTGQLNSPNGIAPDGRGHVYVADTANDRVQKFSRSGRFLHRWGGAGSDPGRFDAPVDVAVDAAGKVYVADHFNARVQKFSPGGRFLDQWAASSPYGLATNPSGHLHVAAYHHDLVEKFSSTGRFLRMWGWGVKDGNNRFQRCGPPRITCWPGLHGSGRGQFRNPEGIATDRRGQVYVADYFNDRIQKFTAGGRFLTAWGEDGSGAGEFNAIHDVATDSAGHVYAVDGVNFRVSKFAQVPPRTRITAVRVRYSQGRAKFRFRSSEGGSSFRCRLDRRRYRRCDSPKVYRHLSPGRHKFKVRATNRDRLTDPTPAKRRFWIEK